MRAGAHQGAGDVRQAQAEGVATVVADELQQVFGGCLPVSDLWPASACVEFVGERGQRHDLARPTAVDEAVMDAGAVGCRTRGCSREAAATTVVLISWAPEG
ncbi:hypothetical protein GCM10010394_46680 [Streptomyces crystallinus]|uniref:Uncharacterized protein n=1 Tax=Streptomyces crystallinus TaxID=68191 RepID=A0ABN1GHC4_9ACTN